MSWSCIPRRRAGAVSADDDVCWICMEPGSLVKPCECPRLVHTGCIARWQLESAGKDEEETCRFCKRALPDWRPALTPADMPPVDGAEMAIVANGRMHRVRVRAGPEGAQEFEDSARRILGIDDLDVINFTFSVQVPGQSHEIQLEGKKAFNAAFHCAAVKAAKRRAVGK